MWWEGTKNNGEEEKINKEKKGKEKKKPQIKYLIGATVPVREGESFG